MSAPDIIAVLVPVADALERLRVPYYISGSVASSAQGVARATADVDLIVALRPEQVRLLVEDLQASYYIDSESIQDAIRRQGSANLIHLATMLKVDLFFPKPRAHDREVFRRLQRRVLNVGDPTRTFPIPSEEDVVLAKLEWYEMGNRISDRQWYDIQGVLKVRGSAIDQVYLRRWAASLGLSALLERALNDAGIAEA